MLTTDPREWVGVLGLAVLLTIATLWFPVILGAPNAPAQVAPTNDATRTE